MGRARGTPGSRGAEAEGRGERSRVLDAKNFPGGDARGKGRGVDKAALS